MGQTKIFEYSFGPDPGPPPIERTFPSVPIPLGWTHLSVRVTYSGIWSGSLQIRPIPQVFFNRFPQPPSPFEAQLPDQTYVTDTGDFLYATCNNGGPGLSATVQLYGDQVVGGQFCQYGTQIIPGNSTLTYLSEGALSGILLRYNMSWAAPFFAPFVGMLLDLGQVCGSPPPPAPPMDANFWSAGLATKQKMLDVLIWYGFCECKPGAPSPIPFPPPHADPPAGLPPPPTFDCANTDLCASVNQLQQMVAALMQSMVEVVDLVTLTQRYHVPFEYIAGSTHSGLRDEGSFQTSRLLGVRVSVLVRPDNVRVLRGNPDYLFDLGWLAIVDGNNQLLDEKRLTRDVQIWLPPLFGAADRFTWSLFPDVVVDVQELLAEP